MQKKAIETRGNVLVSAAAGSGKTAVLVERVISMLTDKNSPVSADKLLIVTFTNAAAAEMRNRIEKRIYEEIQNNPNDDQLQKQKYLLKYADICTIDSFCIKLVRENFEKCGVDYEFYVNRMRDYDEVLPWDHLDYGVTKKFFVNENIKAKNSETTKNCREACSACGATCYGEGVCFERR